MSLESQITALVSAANKLTAEVANKMKGIDNKVDQATQAVPDAVRSLASQRFVVDQERGDDNNNGSQSSPLKSFDEAIKRTPVSNVCLITLVGNYHSDASIPYGCDLYITGLEVGSSNPRDIPKITFGTWVTRVQSTGKDYLRVGGFVPETNNIIAFRDVKIVMPDDSIDPTALKNSFSSVIRHRLAEATASISIVLIDCTVERPLNPSHTLIGAGYVITLAVRAIQVNGEPMEGWWWDGGPGGPLRVDGGTDSKTVANLVKTNLELI